jgi:hypothetical protein
MPCVNREGSSHALNSERVLGRKMCEICPKFRRPGGLSPEISTSEPSKELRTRQSIS